METPDQAKLICWAVDASNLFRVHATESADLGLELLADAWREIADTLETAAKAQLAGFQATLDVQAAGLVPNLFTGQLEPPHEPVKPIRRRKK